MAAIASVLPALTQITSSIASTANYGLTRVLSFTGSFNDDRTSLLLAPAPAPAPPPEQEPTSPSVADETPAPGTFDIEAATPATPLAEGGGGGGQGHHETATHDQDAKSKRVAKSVHTVCLFAASASMVLFVNLPGNKDDDVPSASKPAGASAAAAGEHGPGGGGLYSAGLAFISLGLFSSLGLSMLSIVARPGTAVQKWGMVVAVASVLVAFTLRMCMVLPAASL
ncbi:uncharacterized protein C2845_PM08G03060 [Panicum miliaceum]|uniref:Uncharacterized protein n=1 Tax=Panicum miliaceum TaxID=4540 RepID=A0A3L6R1S4_PANMI|nr:uncharacterized protein C2845_PM08G03060 [Panicum miliaceum]